MLKVVFIYPKDKYYNIYKMGNSKPKTVYFKNLNKLLKNLKRDSKTIIYIENKKIKDIQYN